MPEEPMEFPATTKVHLMLDLERYSSGHLSMTIDSAVVNENEEGQEPKKIGEIRLGMGCGVSVEIGGRIWGINPIDLYKIAKQADDAYLAALERTQR